ncbi:MAG: camphor resistance protein CrcB [Sphingomonas sp. 28-66-16]|nr:MAG: camphor resistance protein CrcB [Sphingomonas sp. 28-66-16]
MISLFLVMLGGAIGSAARLLAGRLMTHWLGSGYPWGTLTVNLVGGLLMGLLIGTLARASMPGENLRLFAAIGVLGGFTTFSSFSLDVVAMIERGALTPALVYVLASTIGSIVALFAGLSVVRALA